VRRLSASRCLFVEYPPGTKDLNDVAVLHGKDAVAAVLNAAKPYPVRGLYRLSDYPEREALPTFSTGWWTLDKHVRLFAGEFMVVTGIPGHGKSTWVLNLLCNLALLHCWRAVLFSPEMPTVPHLRDKLRRIRGELRLG
jgi:twinkle protein